MRPSLQSHRIWLFRLLALLMLCAIADAGMARLPSDTYSGAERYFQGKALELARAAERGDIRAINRLMKVEGVDPDIVFSDDGVPLLAWPLRTRNLDGLRTMLENGADPNARKIDTRLQRGQNRNNAMVYAAMLPDPRYLELLLDHGGNPNTRNSNDETLLLQAFLSQNQWPNVQLLIEHGADINASVYGLADTPLNWYSSRGGFEQSYWLLQHGADPTRRDRLPSDPRDKGRMISVENIYWKPTIPEQIPWQRQCQQWLIDHQIARPPMPEAIRNQRRLLGFPYENEEEIPLIAESPPGWDEHTPTPP